MSETDIGLSELPDGWVWMTVRSAIEKVSIGKKKLKQKNYEEVGKLPVIDQGLAFIGGYTNHEELKVECQLPIVVFGDHTKVFKYVDFDFVAGADGIKVIRPQEMYYPKLFYYFVQAISLPAKGYARHFQFLERAQIPLPPLPEQHRIVAKVEELFTKLDAGINELHKTQAQLKRYRQSVLKAAFEGKLTGAWRAEQPTEIKPTVPIVGDLPDGWGWTMLENCTEILDSQRVPINAKERATRIHGKSGAEIYPYYGATGQVGWIDDYLFDDELVLLGEDGAPFLDFSKDKAYLIKGKSWVNNHAHVLRAQTELMSNQLLCYWLNTYDYHDHVTGTTRLKLNQSMMRKIPVPLPPLSEQHRIVSEVERHFSIADEAEKTVAAELKRAEQLRQSILKKAFSGKLVPQKSSDESASILLEHIKAEKSQYIQEQLRLKLV